uniref:Gamma-glutamylcyclotransferase n=1 Tax=Chelonoidis abingdonii TaxID=106734 RepID=A0A8C0GSQ5_CHEAB
MSVPRARLFPTAPHLSPSGACCSAAAPASGPRPRLLSPCSGAMKRDPPPAERQAQEDAGEQKTPLWIFGYGSLVWRPDFEFSSRKVGFIRGYSRRFWQGDTFHRGNEKMPGRVVTLQEDYDACTWGIAYEVRGEQINPTYLGPASEEDIAAQIIVSSGRSGHNIEYLLRLADFMRYFCPQVEDEHLFSIEEALVSILPCLCQAEEPLVEV